MKKALLLLGSLVVIAGLAFYVLLSNINGIVKNQIETIGSDVLGTQVSVAQVDIKLTQGSGALSGFSIANPAGFSGGSAFSFDKVLLDIDPASVASSPIVIDEILLDAVSARYELNDQRKGNLNTLFDNTKKQSSGAADSGQSSDGPPSQQGGSDVLIRVKKITVKDTKLSLDLTSIGLKEYEDTLPTFYANNIGGEKGLPPDQLGVEIGKVMMKNLTKEAEKKQKDRLKANVKEKAKAKLKEKLGDKLDGELGDKVKGFFN